MAKDALQNMTKEQGYKYISAVSKMVLVAMPETMYPLNIIIMIKLQKPVMPCHCLALVAIIFYNPVIRALP